MVNNLKQHLRDKSGFPKSDHIWDQLVVKDELYWYFESRDECNQYLRFIVPKELRKEILE